MNAAEDFHGSYIDQGTPPLRALIRKAIAISDTFKHLESPHCCQRETCSVVRDWLTPAKKNGMCIDSTRDAFDNCIEYLFKECKSIIKSAINCDDRTKYVS